MSDKLPAVPSIPPLASISDPAARAALKAVIDGWRVRNGEVGDGQEKFLTVADLEAAVSGAVSGNGSSGGGGASTSAAARSVSRVFQGIIDSVSQSRLWKLLGERLASIDTSILQEAKKRGAAITQTQQLIQNTNQSVATQVSTITAALDDAAAALTNEREARVVADKYALARALDMLAVTVGESASAASDSALVRASLDGVSAQKFTKLQTDMNQKMVMFEEGSQLAVSADGAVKGSWSTKFDADGYVVGAGLGIDGKDGEYSSSFMVRADRFVVGSPQLPIDDPNNPPPDVIPFVVLTVADADGNPPGVYLDSAFMRYASIIEAHLADASVGTLKLAGNSVTVQAQSQTATGTATCSITVPFGGKAFVISQTYAQGGSGMANLVGSISCSNGQQSMLLGCHLVDDAWGPSDGHLTLSAGFDLGPGAHSFTVTTYFPAGQGSRTNLYSNIVAFVGQR